MQRRTFLTRSAAATAAAAAAPWTWSRGRNDQSVVRYPDPAVVTLDPRFDRYRQNNAAEACANLCFGGARRNRLFMAASQSLYAPYVDAQGTQVPRRMV